MNNLFTLKRLTPTYARICVGQLCMYYTHGKFVIRRIIRTSASGKTLYVEHIDPDTKRSHYLEIMSRKVYHIVEIHGNGAPMQ